MHGLELAINAGDSLHIIMWKMINDMGLKALQEEFYTMLIRTALGQGVEQIWTNKHKKNYTDKEYFFIADSKSAYYSIAGPMRLGAIVAGATSSQINKITDFGLQLVRCFQLIDDILDCQQDVKEGKVTLATKKGVTYARALAVDAKNKAKVILERDLGFLSHEPARKQLTELADFILEREN
jgi:geranylgeranyl diphosphate synthase type I